MNKNQAAEQISTLFQSAFDRRNYTRFLRNLLNDVEARDNHYSGNTVPDAFKQHVNQYWRIGKYTDPDETEMDLYVVEVKSLSKLDRARTALRNFAVRTMHTFGGKDHALIAFYAKEDNGADWRFSYVKIEHTSKLDEKRGKVKVEKELTPAKRYSFLVGEHENSHTAQAQLVDLLAMDYANPKVEEIEKAFSIEKVTKEFFEQYKDLFIRLSEVLAEQDYFKQDSDDEKRKQTVAKLAKKLLGQIVFLYFLQKKGWLGVNKEGEWGKGVRRFLKKLFADADNEGENYYAEKLQYLFYEALANDRKDQFDPSYYQRFDCRIPFLNGGLFEADYDWQKIRVEIPNTIFANDEKTKAGDKGTGILDVFDRYNFTIKEDEPLEKEVAVDPEMLGKVFENMLDITERKSKGAFYTPREIVHYMCQESLIHYLNAEVGEKTVTAVPKTDIETLVRKGIFAIENDQRILDKGKETDAYTFKLPEAICTHAELIDEKLADIKICDPAIGSGAFPVGMLHEILHARQALAPHLPEAKRLPPYDLKKHTIGHSIYGVDIDPSAIDIARLRLWLSLVVDEDDYTSIDALPNLDYKIMQGNSLIEEYEGVKLFDEAFIEEEPDNSNQIQRLKQEESDISREYIALSQQNKLSQDQKKTFDQRLRKIQKRVKDLQIPVHKEEAPGLFDLISESRKKANQLEDLHQRFFDISSPGEKRRLRDEITRIEWELIEATLAEQDKADALAKLAEYKTSGERPWFLWKLNFSEVFKQKGGFDIVIGNPPYMIIQTLAKASPELVDTYKERYISATGKFDIYCLFAERALEIASASGIANYIMPSKWIGSAFGKGLRKIVSTQRSLLRLISFGSYQVFNASTYSSLVSFSKETNGFMEYGKLEHDIEDATQLENWLSHIDNELTSFELRGLTELPWAFASGRIAKVLNKIKLYRPIEDKLDGIYQGVVTGDNDVFWLRDAEARDKTTTGFSKALDEVLELETEILKPLLYGKTINRYSNKFNNTYLIYPYQDNAGKTVLIGDNELIEKYPLTYSYFERLESRLRSRGSASMKYPHWYALWNPRTIKRMNHVGKILTPDVCHGGCMWIDQDGDFFHSDTSYAIIVKKGYENHIGFFLSVLNSSVSWFYLVNTGSVQRGGYFRFKTSYVKPFPVPETPLRVLQAFTQFQSFLRLPTLGLVHKFFDDLIDGMVLELYFPEEVKAAGKEILPHLGKLTPLTDTMSKEDKLAVIQREFERLYDPNHPVRNHLKTLDSVEEVRIIREALKK